MEITCAKFYLNRIRNVEKNSAHKLVTLYPEKQMPDQYSASFTNQFVFQVSLFAIKTINQTPNILLVQCLRA